MTLSGWLENSFQRHAGREALRCGTRSYSYRELDALSAAQAHALHAAGVRPGDRVGIHLEKNAEAVLALLGALRLGAAYVPLDPRLPRARVEALAAAADLRAVVGAGVAGLPVADVETAAPAVALHATADHAAYLLFTSGSTGIPKAVEISQGAAWAFASWAGAFTGLRPDDTVASTAALGFDLSTYELFSAFGAGARVLLVRPGFSALPGELARLFAAENVTVWYAVPSSIAMLAGLVKVRVLLSAGDVFAPEAAASLRRAGDGRVFNLYGPTETNVCLAHEVGESVPAGAETPIGMPAAGDECRLVTADGALVDSGEGELVVRGPTVMSGYFGDEEATARAFLAADGARWYRTGDLVERAAGGPFFYRGRRDGQVKVWGHRVHPLETERALSAVAGVRQAAVVSVPDPRAGSLLHAFVAGEGLDESALRAVLREKLPAQFVPEEFHLLSALPLTPNGKVDRAALADRVKNGS